VDKWGQSKAIVAFGSIVVIGFYLPDSSPASGQLSSCVNIFVFRFYLVYCSGRFRLAVSDGDLATLIGFAFISFIAPVGFRLMYPNADVGTLIGFANAASQVGTMAGAPVAGFIFASTGSYIPFMTLSSVLLILCIIFVFVATGKRARKNIDYATATLVHTNNSAKL
jgi:predicted MFS family arabinose efflux permease